MNRQSDKPASTVVSIHQPNYLPWLGYFHKMTYSDVFVFMDDVQYTPKTYTNRCIVLQGGRQIRLSIPVSTERWDVTIRGVTIDTANFARKHLTTLRMAYGKSPWFDELMPLIERHYAVGETNLADFNMGLITDIARYIGLQASFVRLSDLALGSSKNDLLIDITRACGGDVFVSGVGAKSYIGGHEQSYLDAGVSLAYQQFIHPRYRQNASPFVPGCSIIDLLFNEGPAVRDILEGQPEPGYDLWRQ